MVHPTRASSLFKFLTAALLSGGTIAACGSNGGDNGFTHPGGGGDETDGGSGSLANGTGGSSGGSLGSGGGDGGGDLGACAATSSKGQQQPLDIFIMLDQSASMDEKVSGGTKWSAVTSALSSFVQSPLNGVSVGLQYFGLPPSKASCPSTCSTDADCGSSGGPCIGNQCIGCTFGGIGGGDSCNAADYSTADVEIAPLPGVASSITASIAKHKPSTNTPTSAALQGAIDHASAWSKAHPGHVVIALLATDGDPTECDTALGTIEGIAKTGVNGTPKILTFVIGVGSSTSNLNGIAQAGGTGNAFIVDTSKNVNQQFLDALNKIRGAAIGCQYQIPMPKSGTPDYGKVNVQFVPGGGSAEILPKVADAAHCAGAGDAWYYDDNAHPTQILLCDAACKKVTGDAKGEVDVLTGCQSVVR